MAPVHNSLTVLLALFIVYAHSRPSDAAEQVLTITTQSGAKMRSLLSGDTDGALANLILLPGGNGKLIISGKGEIKKMSNNFVVRTRAQLADAKFLTAVVDAPFDRRSKKGLLGGFRASEEHASDLATIARKLTQLNGKPVVVVGTSRGTVSAANLAARAPNGVVSAAVLTSSLVGKSKAGASLLDLQLTEIKVPVLFVHNQNDGCKHTRLKDVKPVVAQMKKGGVATDLILVTSKAKKSKPCKALSPHGFLGIEDKVVGEIVSWIKNIL